MNKYITQGGITINGEVVSGFNSAQICDNDGLIIPAGTSGTLVFMSGSGEDIRLLKEGESVMTEEQQYKMAISNISVTEEGEKFFEDVGKDLEETERKYKELSKCINQLGDIYNGIVHELKKLNVDKAKNATLMVELYKRLTMLENWMKILKIKMNSLNKDSIDQE